MTDPRIARLEDQARKGLINRRDMLSTGLKLGLATPVITGLMALAPEESLAAPRPSGRLLLPRAQDGSSSFTYLRDGGFPDIDPHSQYDNAAAAIVWQIYDMLIQYKGTSTSEYDPMLADSWDQSDDLSTYTFHLNPSATFHDGDPVTADSVKQSFTRLLKMGLGPVNVISRFLDDPEKIQVVDDHTVTFNLGTPQPLFLSAMAASYGPFIINSKYVDQNKTDDDPWAHEWFLANATGAGSGPYKLDSLAPTEQAVLKKNDAYYRGWDGNHFDTIVCRVVTEGATRRELMEQNQADATSQNLTPDDVDALRGNTDLQVVTFDSTAVFWCSINFLKSKTATARQGFSYAFPYEEVMNSAYRGLIKRSGPIPSTVRGYDPGVFLYQTDLDKAKQLIIQGGFAEGDTFDYVVPSGDAIEPTISQLFQANMQQMGFNLEISEMERSALVDMMYGGSGGEDRPFFVGGWGWWPDYNDSWNQLKPNFTKTSNNNAGLYVNDQFEELMNQVEHYTDENVMNQQMAQIQNILTEQDPPAIFYGQLLWYVIMQKDIAGAYFNPLYLNQYPFWAMSRAAS